MKTALVTKDNQGGLLIYLHLPELHDVNTLRSILFCSVYCGQVLKFFTVSTVQRPIIPSFRNQSIGLQSKSIDWLLYDGSIGP